MGIILAIIASAYVWYFVGMAVSLAAGAILGISGKLIAQVFAWIGVGFIAIIFVKMTINAVEETTVKREYISEEELAGIIEEISKEDD